MVDDSVPQGRIWIDQSVNLTLHCSEGSTVQLQCMPPSQIPSARALRVIEYSGTLSWKEKCAALCTHFSGDCCPARKVRLPSHCPAAAEPGGQR